MIKPKLKKNKEIKAWAVINRDWKFLDWRNPFYSRNISVVGELNYTFAIFENRKEAKIFFNHCPQQGDKIVPVKITILDK